MMLIKIEEPGHFQRGSWLRIGADMFQVEEVWLNVTKLGKPKKQQRSRKKGGRRTNARLKPTK